MTDVNVETVYVNVVIRGTPAVVVQSVYAEALIRETPKTVLETAYVAVVLTAGAEDTAFVGWGVPR